MSKGHLVALIGPSGCGKGTLLKRVLAAAPNTFYSVSATTRSPRAGEVNGRDYYFMSVEEFDRLLADDGLLEYARYVGNYYGTPRRAVLDRLDAGQNVILEIEIQGARQVREKYPEAVAVFILPPNLAELRQRLVDRGTESEQVVNERMKRSLEEIEYAYECDYVVVNDEIEAAVSRVCAILTALGCREDRMEPEIGRVLGERGK